MEAQSNIENLNRIQRIAYSKIPISEENPLYNHFLQRRELAIRLNRDMLTEDNREDLLEIFKYTEDKIKQYLHL